MRDLIRQKIIDSQAAPLPEFTRRDVRLPGVQGKAIAVIGMRRTGKTTFLWQILADRVKQGTPREGLLFFGFEDERLADMSAKDMDLIVEEYYTLHPEWRDKRKAVFFLDEVQVVQKWEMFARRLLDTEKIELFLSGSSARLLSREVATSMRGRAMEALIHPFSFREYLRYHNREPEQPVSHKTKATQSRLDRDLREYLSRGGFPESMDLNARDRYELLRGYVDVALLRDVIERHAVSNPVALRWMVRQLLSNAAGEFSVSKFFNDLKSQGIAVSRDTLHALLSYLEDAFLLRTVSLATDSERRRMVNPRKVYPIDPALIPIYDRSGKENRGHALETCVLLELERRGAEIAYVKTANGYEVDFLARFHDGRQELIQVCTDLDTPETLERESRGLAEASIEHKQATLHLITLARPTRVELPKKVHLHLASDWLLEPPGQNG
jgi:hypothetical protein